MSKVETVSNADGWMATTCILAKLLTGTGCSKESALYSLQTKVDEVFWEVQELRDQISRMATDAMNEEPE